MGGWDNDVTKLAFLRFINNFEDKNIYETNNIKHLEAYYSSSKLNIYYGRFYN